MLNSCLLSLSPFPKFHVVKVRVYKFLIFMQNFDVFSFQVEEREMQFQI